MIGNLHSIGRHKASSADSQPISEGDLSIISPVFIFLRIRAIKPSTTNETYVFRRIKSQAHFPLHSKALSKPEIIVFIALKEVAKISRKIKRTRIKIAIKRLSLVLFTPR